MCASRWMRGRASSTARWTTRLSAFRFLLLFFLVGEVSVADGKKAGTTPSFLVAPLSFALHVTAFAKLGRVSVRERCACLFTVILRWPRSGFKRSSAVGRASQRNRTCLISRC